VDVMLTVGLRERFSAESRAANNNPAIAVRNNLPRKRDAV